MLYITFVMYNRFTNKLCLVPPTATRGALNRYVPLIECFYPFRRHLLTITQETRLHLLIAALPWQLHTIDPFLTPKGGLLSLHLVKYCITSTGTIKATRRCARLSWRKRQNCFIPPWKNSYRLWTGSAMTSFCKVRK